LLEGGSAIALAEVTIIYREHPGLASSNRGALREALRDLVRRYDARPWLTATVAARVETRLQWDVMCEGMAAQTFNGATVDARAAISTPPSSRPDVACAETKRSSEVTVAHAASGLEAHGKPWKRLTFRLEYSVPMQQSSDTVNVTYGDWQTGLTEYKKRLLDLFAKERPLTVADVGGGANPSLSPEEVRELGIQYTLLDISAAELEKASDTYQKVLQDVCAPLPVDHKRYDVVFSHMLAEHVAKPLAFHRNLYQLLEPNGVAAHLMPTYYEPAFLLNHILPERASAAVLKRMQSNRDFDHLEGKFPAYYRWCRGPSRQQIRRLGSTGFQVEQMTGYFGTGYLARFQRVQRAYDRAWVSPLLRHPVPQLTSYCWMVLRRPFEQ
jgi:SAM-dependent methyltransferase